MCAVLSPGMARLVSMELDDYGWNDLGHSERVISVVARKALGLAVWAARWRSQNARESNAEQLSASMAVEMPIGE